MIVDTEKFQVLCSDGSSFMLFDEHVRGERRFYWTQHRIPGESRYKRTPTGEGNYSKAVAWTECRRLAREWEEAHPVKKVYDRRKWRRH